MRQNEYLKRLFRGEFIKVRTCSRRDSAVLCYVLDVYNLIHTLMPIPAPCMSVSAAECILGTLCRDRLARTSSAHGQVQGQAQAWHTSLSRPRRTPGLAALIA